MPNRMQTHKLFYNGVTHRVHSERETERDRDGKKERERGQVTLLPGPSEIAPKGR